MRAVVASRVDRNADSLRKEWLRLHTNLDDGGNEYKLALARFNHEWDAHLAPDHLAKAANRLDSLLGGYDLATSEQQ